VAPIHHDAALERGALGYHPLHEKIRNREFSAIVLPIDLDIDPDAWMGEEWWTQFSEKTADLIHKYYGVAPRLGPGNLPREWRTMDRRFIRGYNSPFWTDYLYLPRSQPLP